MKCNFIRTDKATKVAKYKIDKATTVARTKINEAILLLGPRALKAKEKQYDCCDNAIKTLGPLLINQQQLHKRNNKLR